MLYISISNVRVEEASVEYDDGEFCVIRLMESGSRIMVRKSRLHEDKRKLEEKPGIGERKKYRTPWDYLH